jgi:hypothetical protein
MRRARLTLIFFNFSRNHMRLFISAVVVGAGLTAAYPLAAQELRAITEDGRKVLLEPDGKWRFDGRASPTASLNSDTTSPYQTSVKRFAVSFNTADWVLLPKREADGNKRTFRHRSLPLYGMVIADELPAATPAIKSLMLTNARAVGASTTILVDQTRTLGDTEVGALRFAASMDGLDFVFSSHYFANGDGNIQVLCYTAQALFFKYQGDCQKFIDGLQIKKAD